MAKKGAGYKQLVFIVIGIWVGVALGVLILWGLAASGKTTLTLPGSSSSALSTPLQGNIPAPDFLLDNVDGEQVSLEQWSGSVVVLNFWATWCGPCIREIPMFQEYHLEYYPDLIILGVNAEEKPQEVKEFIDQIDVSYEILLDVHGEVGRLYKVIALPATVFIDEQGDIRFQHIGFLSEEQFAGYLQELGVVE